MRLADDIGRQELYADAWHEQLKAAVECGTRMRSLQEWKARQLGAEMLP